MLARSVVSSQIDPAVASNRDKAEKSYWDLSYSNMHLPQLIHATLD
jgi:hypothetical protein